MINQPDDNRRLSAELTLQQLIPWLKLKLRQGLRGHERIFWDTTIYSDCKAESYIAARRSVRARELVLKYKNLNEAVSQPSKYFPARLKLIVIH